MKFEWDERKCTTNVKKHGIDFADADELFSGYTITMEDDRFHYNEQRFFTLGMIKGRVAVVVHTERNDRIRIISMRKATKYEQKIYFSQIQD
ncbi:MAG: BrnT family toxin [Candidatus Scalindua sp. AMX11]|nr:BrnT family toxin [Planctomycetota bacterium]RZV60885.1 MAG: BrnT family toxin [Candidatus Scalindua sp. SCAELEC01]TDE63155.1 MAG: BrnT family toxin [Candidatus Scalindua sp. AMX11]